MEAVARAVEPPHPVRKPVGGYRLIHVVPMLAVFYAYRRELIRYRDVRVWFALHEMISRRCDLDPDRAPSFTLGELRSLVGGVGGEHLRSSLRRLERCGLATWSETEIRLDASPDRLPVDDLSSFWSMVALVANHRRRVPVPRRTLRLIAQTGRPVVVATMLGYLLRCVYFRDGGVVSQGCCKASWVAAVFGVDARNVKAARKHLASIAWLTLEDSQQWHKQRYGGRAVVNLAFERPLEELTTESPPLGPEIRTESSPPESDRKLPSEQRNQKPALAAGRPAGFFTGKEKFGEPSLRDVKADDLRDTHRLLVLFEQATQAGIIGDSHGERLNFVSAAEHALVKGTRNPPGLFLHLVRNRLWHFCTNDDEDAANQRLKRYLYGAAKKREREEVPRFKSIPVVVSEDAKLVSAVMNIARQHRLGDDGFYLLKRERPEWTRDRWIAAVGELDAARLKRALGQSRNEDGCCD